MGKFTSLPPGRGGPRDDDFWGRVYKTHHHGCWLWDGPFNKQGYGCWKRTTAPRHSWILTNGAIPDGLWVLHYCDMPPCVNPLHLYLGTGAENAIDIATRSRHLDRHDPARRMDPADLKLTLDTLTSLADGSAYWQRRRTRVSQGKFAEALGVVPSTVSLWETGAHTPSPAHALAYGRLLADLTQTSPL